MAAQDARLAEDVNRAVHEDVVGSTRRSYDSVTKKYVEFCEVRGLRPFPVDDITLAGWILVLCTSVKESAVAWRGPERWWNLVRESTTDRCKRA